MCAIFGITNTRKAAELAAQGLHAQQHRAEDFAGIAASDGTNLHVEYGDGKVLEALPKVKLNRLHGLAAIGHTRYPTPLNGEDEIEEAERLGQINIQPVEGLYGSEKFYLAHNGNLVNYKELKAQFPDIRFRTLMDSEVIVRLLERAHTGNLVEDLRHAVKPLVGTGSILILFKDRLVAFRDPSGSHPLVWGTLGSGHVFASETRALDALRAAYGGEVEAGTFAIVENGRMEVHRFAEPRLKRCPFELIYFASHTSVIFGVPVLDFRERAGRLMEERYPVPGADYVLGVPHSGSTFAVGFALSGRSGRYSTSLEKSQYAARTFIQATADGQREKAQQKYELSPSSLAGKKVVVVDDSIIRLNTLPIIADMLWDAGVAEIHFRIMWPPTTDPCFYGIKMESKDKLIAAKASVEQIRTMVHANSLEFMQLDDLLALAGGPKDSWCTACLTGEYWHEKQAA